MIESVVAIRRTSRGQFVLVSADDPGMVWGECRWVRPRSPKASRFDSREAAEACAGREHFKLSTACALAGGQFYGNKQTLNGLELSVCEALLQAGAGVVRHGWPDLLCELPVAGKAPLIFAVEVKSVTDEASDIQRSCHALLKSCGIPVLLITSPYQITAATKRLLWTRDGEKDLDKLMQKALGV